MSAIEEQDYLIFPDHPKFEFQPASLIGFDQWVCTGIYVPLEKDTQKLGEHDPHLIPTISLQATHQDLSSDSVPVLPRADAWRIATDDGWKEPVGTRKGVWGLELNPYKRTLKALNQFIQSRSSSLSKPHQSLFHSFRAHTGLISTSSGPHIPSNYTPGSLRQGDTLGMHEEESAFLRNMGECLDGVWEEVVGFPPGGVKGVGGVRCWEIIHSFLLYISHYEIYPSTEPFLVQSLSSCINHSRTLLHKTQLICTLYSSVWGRSDSLGVLAMSVWAGWIGERGRFRRDWDAVQAEVDLEALDGEIVRELESVEEEEDGEVWKGNDAGGWDEAPEMTTLSQLSKEAALTKLQTIIGQSIDPESYTTTSQMISTTLTITSVTLPSLPAEPKTLTDLAIVSNPDGYLVLSLTHEQSAKGMRVLVERANTDLNADKLKDALGLKIKGSILGLQKVGLEKEEEEDWFLVDIEGVEV